MTKVMERVKPEIEDWINNRFGVPNTFNRQLLYDFLEFAEKELGYVIKDPDQSLPNFITWDFGDRKKLTQIYKRLLKENWFKTLPKEEKMEVTNDS